MIKINTIETELFEKDNDSFFYLDTRYRTKTVTSVLSKKSARRLNVKVSDNYELLESAFHNYIANYIFANRKDNNISMIKNNKRLIVKSDHLKPVRSNFFYDYNYGVFLVDSIVFNTNTKVAFNKYGLDDLINKAISKNIVASTTKSNNTNYICIDDSTNKALCNHELIGLLFEKFFQDNYQNIKDSKISLLVKTTLGYFVYNFIGSEYNNKARIPIDFINSEFYNDSNVNLSHLSSSKHDYERFIKNDPFQLIDALSVEEIKLISLFLTTGDMKFSISKVDTNKIGVNARHRGNGSRVSFLRKKNINNEKSFIKYIFKTPAFMAYINIYLRNLFMATGITKSEILQIGINHAKKIDQAIDRILDGYEKKNVVLEADAISAISDLSKELFEFSQKSAEVLEDEPRAGILASSNGSMISIAGKPRPALANAALAAEKDPEKTVEVLSEAN